MLSNKQFYQSFCAEQNGVPLFLQYDWFVHLFEDAEWDVAVAHHGDRIVGILPYVYSEKWLLKRILPPHFTPYQGPWLIYPDISGAAKKRSFEKKVMFDLIAQLPKVNQFVQQFHPKIENWLPFYWKGYSEQTKYTYLLERIKEHQAIFQGFKESLRREIRKAEKNLFVSESQEIADLIDLKHKAYTAKNEQFNYSTNHVNKIFNLIREKKCGVLLEAKDKKGHLHAIVFIVWDTHQAYYLIGAANPVYKTSGAISLLMWKAIQEASKYVDVFNFEGSMIPSIERYFRSFGGTLSPYYRVTKSEGLIAKLLEIRN